MARARKGPNPKHLRWQGHGMSVFVSHHPSKTGKGRERLWISIRNASDKKPFRVAECLSYARAVDIQFERA